MTAPPSDERREVAARLRAKREECDGRDYPWMTDDLILALGYEHDYEADNGIFDRLADLIDPTCHMVREYADTELGRVFQGWVCDECMGTADVPDASEPPEYCPHCGARVTGGGDA